MPKKATKLNNWKLKRVEDSKVIGGTARMNDGTPHIVPLILQSQDDAFRGHEYVRCCDCELQHLQTFELFYDEGDLFLQIRAYRTGKKGRTNG